MDIYSVKFWRLVALILIVDLFFIELTFHRGMQTDTSADHWDFRINELRQIEATPKVQALNSGVQTSRAHNPDLRLDWLAVYFPGQSVPRSLAETWRLHLPKTRNPADETGKVL